MIHTAALAGLLIGFLRGGRIRNLASHRIRLIPVLIISFLLEAVVVFDLISRAAINDDMMSVLRTAAAASQYLLVIIFLVYNAAAIKEIYVKAALVCAAAGSAANAAVILANKGQMPISLVLTEKIAGLHAIPIERIAEAPHYVLAHADTPLLYLGDWLPIWSFGWYMVSPGDFFIAAGLAIFTYWLTKTPLQQKLNNLEQPENIVYTNGR